MRLPACEHRPEVGFGQDASDFFAFVSLDFDLAVFYRAASSASLLHRPRQALFLRQADADEPFDDGHSLAATPGLLSDDIHTSTVLARRCFLSFLRRLRRCGRAWRLMDVGQISKGIMTELF